MIEQEYSIKDQGYLVRIACDRCQESEVSLWRSKELPLNPVDATRILIYNLFPEWSLQDQRILCPRCNPEPRERDA